MSWYVSVGVNLNANTGQANAGHGNACQGDNGLHVGAGKCDAAEIASVLISDAQVMASNFNDEQIRDWALDASPLDRLLAERGPLDQYRDGQGTIG